jgi:hypothetical protein
MTDPLRDVAVYPSGTDVRNTQLVADGVYAVDDAVVAASTEAASRALSSEGYVSAQEPAGPTSADVVLRYTFESDQVLNRFSLELANVPSNWSVWYYDARRGAMVQMHDSENNPVGGSLVGIRHEAKRVDGPGVGNIVPSSAAMGAWVPLNLEIPLTETREVEIRMDRRVSDEIIPIDSASRQAVPYAVACRNVRFRYEVRTKRDVDVANVFRRRHRLGHHERMVVKKWGAEKALDRSWRSYWKSEPQPTADSIVCLYLDVRDELDAAQLVDRIFMAPLYTGVSVNVYYSNDDEGEPAALVGSGDVASVDADTEWDLKMWTPIFRDFVARKGLLHITPVKAKYLKLEFTDLARKPYPLRGRVRRRVRSFPGWVRSWYKEADKQVADGRYEETGKTMLFDGEGFIQPDLPDIGTAPILEADIPEDITDEAAYVKERASSSRARFFRESRHVYEWKWVRFHKKHAYFAGVRSLRVFRVDETQAYDTPEVLETLQDDTLIASTSWEDAMTDASYDGELIADGAGRTLVSKTMGSFSDFRSLQIAAVGSDWDQHQTDTEMALATNTHLVLLGGSSVAGVQDGGAAVSVNAPVPWEFGARTTAVASIGRSRASAFSRFTVEGGDDALVEIRLRQSGNVIAHSRLRVGVGTEAQIWCAGLSEAGGTITAEVVVLGGSEATRLVLRSLGSFQHPVLWEVSNDGGTTWAPVVRALNDPEAWVSFADADNQLKVRATAVRAGAWIGGYTVVPWYIDSGLVRRRAIDVDPPWAQSDGPEYRDTHHKPMFKQWDRPFPQKWAQESFAPEAGSGAIVVRVVEVAFSAEISPSGQMRRGSVPHQVVGGTVAPTGAVASTRPQMGHGGSSMPEGRLSIVKITAQAVSGSLTPSGAIARDPAGKVFLGGAIAPFGTPIKTLKMRQPFQAAIGPVGSLVRSWRVVKPASVGPSGALIVQYQPNRYQAGQVEMSGTVATVVNP